MHKVYYIHTEENISKSQIQGANVEKKLLGIGTERTYTALTRLSYTAAAKFLVRSLQQLASRPSGRRRYAAAPRRHCLGYSVSPSGRRLREICIGLSSTALAKNGFIRFSCKDCD